MADQTKPFTIHGKEYPIPTVQSFDMDEAQILWELCGFGMERFQPDENEGRYSAEAQAELVKVMISPPFLRTLLHVAYRRGNRQASRKDIDQALGRLPFTQVLDEWSAQLLADEEDDASPPDPSRLMSAPPASSPRSSESSSGSSGNGSPAVSDEPDATLASIGATR